MLFDQSLNDKHLGFLPYFSIIACILQKCQGHIWQIKTEEYSRLKEVKMASCLKVMCHPEIYPELVKSYRFNTWCFIGRIGTLWIWTVHGQYYCVNVNCRDFVLWLCIKMSLSSGNIHWRIRDKMYHVYNSLSNASQSNTHIPLPPSLSSIYCEK